MKDNYFDEIVKDELNNEVKNITMSEVLKNRIRDNTINKEDTLLQKIRRTMNRTIEIPIVPAVAGCIIIFMIAAFPLEIVSTAKKHEIIKESNNFVIVNTGSFQLVLDKGKEGIKSENSKN